MKRTGRKRRGAPGQAYRRLAIGVVIALAASTAGAQEGEVVPRAEPGWTEADWTDEHLGAAMELRDLPRLHLNEPGDPKLPAFGHGLHELRPEVREGVGVRRGMLLTPLQRLALYGQNTSERRRDAEEARRLARRELWVVLLPWSGERSAALLGEETAWEGDPWIELGRASVATMDAEILWPREVELVATREEGRRVVEPLWSETVDFPFAAGLHLEWVRRRSLVVAFPLDDLAILERRIRIHVEYGVEGGDLPYDSATFYLDRFAQGDWAVALGEASLTDGGRRRWRWRPR